MKWSINFQAEIRTSRIALYTRSIVETEAYACFNAIRQICTKNFFGIILSVHKDEIKKESIDSHIYQQIMEDKIWNGTQLEKD